MRARYLIPIVAIAQLAFANSSAASESRRFGIGAFVGYNTYSMNDVNQAITPPGTIIMTTSADKISGGASFGGGIRLQRSEHVVFALDASRLLAKSTGTAIYSGQPHQAELEVPATAVTFTVDYLVNTPSRVEFGIGAGTGYYICTGSASASGVHDFVDLSGSGFGFHGLGIAEIGISRSLKLDLGAGYRYAKTTDIEADSILRNEDGSEAKVDWSGFMSRAGLTIYSK